MKPEGINRVTTRMHIARAYAICSCTKCASNAMSAASTEESQEAWQLALSSDESVVLWELLLDLHTLCVEKKLLLFRLSIERSLGSEEGARTLKRSVFSESHTIKP